MLLSSPLPPFALYSFLNSIELQEQGITKHLVVGRADGYNIIGGRRPTSRGTGDLAEKRRSDQPAGGEWASCPTTALERIGDEQCSFPGLMVTVVIGIACRPI